VTQSDLASGARPGTRVLVIDDEEIIHASVNRVLSRAGFTSEAVFTAREAMERLEQETFDLVITDLMMPGMNGIELLEALQEKGIEVPILMITGYPTIRTAMEAMRLGAMDYLAKPFTRKELLSPVKRALRLSTKELPVFDPTLDSGSVKAADLRPGDVVYLPHHAWARYEQNGLFTIGVEASFLAAAGGISGVASPRKMELVEQGAVGLRLVNDEGEEHGVAMPFTGQVVEVNEAIMQAPDRIRPDTWAMRLLPSDIESEIGTLVRRDRAGR
jgi:DNA-binding response OmpR family regulator